MLDEVCSIGRTSEVIDDRCHTSLLDEQVCGEKRLSIGDSAAISGVQGVPILDSDHLGECERLTLVLDLGDFEVFSAAIRVQGESF
jgi:hypothetical protein